MTEEERRVLDGHCHRRSARLLEATVAAHSDAGSLEVAAGRLPAPPRGLFGAPKREHYLAFLEYPELIRRSLSPTNAVEALNGQLEIVRRNGSGYFRSEDVLKLKLGMANSTLEGGRWSRSAASIATSLNQMNAIFERRFEEAA